MILHSPSRIDMMQRNAGQAEAMLKLLANANRLMVLCHLVKGGKTVGQLADLVGLSDSALSQHLAKMRAAGLVKADRHGQEMFYRISDPNAEALLSTLYLIYCK